MADSDIEQNVIKNIDGQFIFSSGMNLVTPATVMPVGSLRQAINYDLRYGQAVKAKGQRPAHELEIGAFYYDRFFTEDIDLNKWNVFTEGTGTIDIFIASNNEHKLRLNGPAIAELDSLGLASLTALPREIGSYVEIHVEHVSGSTGSFTFTINGDNTTLDTDSGISIILDASNDILSKLNGSSSGTGLTYTDDVEVVFRIETTADGFNIYRAVPELVFGNGPTEDQVLVTTVTVPNPSHLQFHAEKGTWLVNKVVTHDGFGDRGERHSPQGAYRFYREGVTTDNETIIMAYGKIYKFTDEDGFIEIAKGFDIDATWEYETIQDEMFATNNVDRPIRYDGSNVNVVGAGDTIAPIAEFIRSHLQSLFLATKNTVFRNDPTSLNVWDEIEPTVDVDAWKGDVIVGLLKMGTGLYIIKSESVWVLYGRTNATFTLDRLLGTEGCIAPKSIATDGALAFWRGIDGVYRFDGASTILISLAMHPLLKRNEQAILATSNFDSMEKSVGILHDNRYRLALVQNGEASIDFNNYEYVYDLLGNNGNGLWQQRSNRNVAQYVSFGGKGDSDELFYIPSDDSNTWFQAEVENGNSRNGYTNVSKRKFYDVDFAGRLLIKHIMAPIGRRQILTKEFQRVWIHYEPTGTHFVGVRMFTMNNLAGTLKVFQVKPQEHLGLMDLDGSTLLDGKAPLGSPDYMMLFNQNLDAQKNKNKGIEIWCEIIQSQDVRDLVNNDGDSDTVALETGLNKGIGNYEHHIIRDITFTYTEENY